MQGEKQPGGGSFIACPFKGQKVRAAQGQPYAEAKGGRQQRQCGNCPCRRELPRGEETKAKGKTAQKTPSEKVCRRKQRMPHGRERLRTRGPRNDPGASPAEVRKTRNMRSSGSGMRQGAQHILLAYHADEPAGFHYRQCIVFFLGHHGGDFLNGGVGGNRADI